MEQSHPRRPSSTEQSDESTIEIATPVLVDRGGKREHPYLGYIDPSTLGSASLQGQSESPETVLATYQNRPTRPASIAGSEPELSSGSDDTALPRHAGEGEFPSLDHAPLVLMGLIDVRISEATTQCPVLVSTPPRSPDSAQPRSVPEPTSPRPPLSPGMFGIASTPNSPTSPSRLSISVSPVTSLRYSQVPGLVHDCPSPPTEISSKMTTEASSSASLEKHASAFGQVVTGPPGAGKTTYCHGMHQVSPSKRSQAQLLKTQK